MLDTRFKAQGHFPNLQAALPCHSGRVQPHAVIEFPMAQPASSVSEQFFGVLPTPIMKQIFSFILGLLALALTVGCKTKSADLNTTRIIMTRGTNRAEILQPKDCKWKKLNWTDDGIEILEYVSAANAGAIELETVRAKSSSDLLMQGIMLGREGAQMYMRYQGIPLPPNPQAVPLPTTVSTNR